MEKKDVVTERYLSQSTAQRQQNLQKKMETYVLSVIRQKAARDTGSPA